MEVIRSLLVSNILDPLTHSDDELKEMYSRIAKQNRYKAIETRLIRNSEVMEVFNSIATGSCWDVTIWLTGDMSKANLNISSFDDVLRKHSINETFKLIDLATKHHCNRVGVSSGVVEDVARIDEHVNIYAKSIMEIIEYIEHKEYNVDLIIEPLDQFAHKKNVMGNLNSCLYFIRVMQGHRWLDNGRLTLCWDSAHVALNEDEFKESIRILYKYISRIHFADAVLDKNDEEYGDNHRMFDNKGFMNIETAREIISLFKKYETENKRFFLACEVRTKKKEEAWSNEQQYYEFLDTVLGK